MSGWPILDIAIGMCFVYLLLSTICTALTEGITTQLRSRAKYLDRGLTSLLGGEQDIKDAQGGKAAQGIKKEFYAHPAIQAFSYHQGDSVMRRVSRTVAGVFRKGAETQWADQRPSYIPGDKFAVAVLALKDKYPALQKTIDALAPEDKSDAQKIEALHIWYDQVMDRVTGWYKRHSQAWIRFLAIVVVVALNADTLRVAQILWNDPTLRQVTVEQAKARLKEPPPEAVAVEYHDGDETLPEGGPDQVGTPGDSSDKHLGLNAAQWQLIEQLMSWDEDLAVLNQRMEEKSSQMTASQASGGTAAPGVQPGPASPPQESGFDFGIFLGWVGFVLKRHLIGWLLTVVAVSLGAPFWYDALNRLVNIRNAGTAPAKAEPKKEAKA